MSRKLEFCLIRPCFRLCAWFGRTTSCLLLSPWSTLHRPYLGESFCSIQPGLTFRHQVCWRVDSSLFQFRGLECICSKCTQNLIYFTYNLPPAYEWLHTPCYWMKKFEGSGTEHMKHGLVFTGASSSLGDATSTYSTPKNLTVLMAARGCTTVRNWPPRKTDVESSRFVLRCLADP